MVISHPGVFEESPGEDGRYDVRPEVMSHLKSLVADASSAGLFVVIAFRTGPGRNEEAITGPDTVLGVEPLRRIWSIRRSGDRARRAWAEMWKETAREFRDVAAVVGYELMVEPDTRGRERYWNILTEWSVSAVRSEDSSTPVLIAGPEGGTACSLNSAPAINDARVVFTVHQYEPYDYAHQQRAGVEVDTSRLRIAYECIDRFRQERQKPVAVTEYGAYRWASGSPEFIADQARRIEVFGGNHSLWLWETWSHPLNYSQFDLRSGMRKSAAPDTMPASDDALIHTVRTIWSANTLRP